MKKRVKKINKIILIKKHPIVTHTNPNTFGAAAPKVSSCPFFCVVFLVGRRDALNAAQSPGCAANGLAGTRRTASSRGLISSFSRRTV